MSYTGLDNTQLQKLVPAAFADYGWTNTGEKFNVIPTIQVVDMLRDNGFIADRAVQRICHKTPDRTNTTKHMIIFRHQNYLDGETGEVPELVLINANDKTASYDLSLGFFRIACCNGLIVMNESLGQMRVRHYGQNNKIDNVIEGSYEIIEQAPQMLEHIEQFKTIELSDAERMNFATKAYEIAKKKNIKAEDLLQVNRFDDKGNSLWKTFNVVQENIIRGGLAGIDANGRRTKTRQISNVNDNVRINKLLWALTEDTAKLAA